MNIENELNSDLHNVSNIALDEIRKLNNANGKVTFVSGNFNIIHPGHLRLLRFAAECGDFLVVGVLDKNSPGAILPDYLRLESIKSINWVNYAFILQDSPEDFIKVLKPDVVVKGNEYENTLNPEQDVVNQYGGKLIFNSGDLTFSSLDLLKKEFSEINFSAISKPVDYPRRHNFNIKDLVKVFSLFKKLKVVVVGDLIVDEYITCDALGMSQEDPTIVVKPILNQKYIGGASIVAAHAKSLGADVDYFTVVGKDTTADFAKEKLKNYGVNSYFLVDENRPTSLKQRFRTEEKTLLRVSYLRQNYINKNLEKELLNSVLNKLRDANLLIFSDFNYGILPQGLVNELISYCTKNNILMVADSQSSSQVGDISRYEGVELLTPTEREARLAMRDYSSGLVVLAENLRIKAKSKHLIIKLGREGLLVHTPSEESKWLTDKLPAMNSVPKDVAGAGDSLLTCLSLAMASGFPIWDSAYLGAIAAACQISRIGNIPLTPDELIREINN